MTSSFHQITGNRAKINSVFIPLVYGAPGQNGVFPLPIDAKPPNDGGNAVENLHACDDHEHPVAPLRAVLPHLEKRYFLTQILPHVKVFQNVHGFRDEIQVVRREFSRFSGGSQNPPLKDDEWAKFLVLMDKNIHNLVLWQNFITWGLIPGANAMIPGMQTGPEQPHVPKCKL